MDIKEILAACGNARRALYTREDNTVIFDNQFASKTFDGKPHLFRIVRGKENRFSSDTGKIYYDGRKQKLAHEVGHAAYYATTGKRSMGAEDDDAYLMNPSEIVARCMEVENCNDISSIKAIIAGYGVGEVADLLIDCLENQNPKMYDLYMKDGSSDEKHYCDELAENDCFIGRDNTWVDYLDADMATIEEWKAAGKKFAKDCYDSGEFDQADYEECLDYYEDFSL